MVLHETKVRADGDHFAGVKAQMAAPRLGVSRPDPVGHVPNMIDKIHII
jgi:hypothetical protein